MTYAEATFPENAATVAEQGAHVAPETASSKKGSSRGYQPEEGSAQGNRKALRAAKQGFAEEGGQGQQEGQTRPGQESQHAARRDQGSEDPGDDRATQGSTA